MLPPFSPPLACSPMKNCNKQEHQEGEAGTRTATGKEEATYAIIVFSMYVEHSKLIINR